MNGVNAIPSYRDQYNTVDSKNFLWPRALLFVGHHHVLPIGLEEACKSLDKFDCFFNSFGLWVFSWHQSSCDVFF